MKHSAFLLLGLTLLTLTGCKVGETLKALPAGTQLQSSTTGLRFAPAAADGAPLTFGSHTSIVTTANPPDAGANVNRFEAKAPGIHLKSTVATGAVGDELQKAGGPEALRYLLGSEAATPKLPPAASLKPSPTESWKLPAAATSLPRAVTPQ